MADVVMHPAMRRPTPMLNTEPLPDEALPAMVAGDVMEVLRVYSGKLAKIYGEEAARHIAHGCVEDGLREAR